MSDDTTPPPGAGPDQPQDEPQGPGPAGATTATETAGPTGPSRPVLRRSSTDRVISGVAGGLARTFDLDPVVVRIITVVVCLAFPPALVAYLGAWLLVARDDQPPGSVSGGIALRRAGGIAFWIGVAILAIVTLALIDEPFRGGSNLVPLVLIGIGVALWTRDGRSRSSGAVAAPDPQTTWPTSATPPTHSAPAGADMPTTQTAPGAGAAPPPRPPTSQPAEPRPVPPGPPPPPRPKSPLGAISIALALIVTGVVAALDQVPGVPLDADPSHLAAVALLVLGLGQLVGTYWGRARWLTLVAIFLIPPVLVGAVVRGVDGDFAFSDGINIGDGVGERVLVLHGADALPRDISLLAGTITVDLEDWEPTAAQLDAIAADDSDLVVNVGAGEVVLITPTDVPWRVVGTVGLGDTSVTSNDALVQRNSSDNLGSPLEVLRTGGPQDGPVLDIVVDLRVGELDLHTPPFTAPTEELS